MPVRNTFSKKIKILILHLIESKCVFMYIIFVFMLKLFGFSMISNFKFLVFKHNRVFFNLKNNFKLQLLFYF